MRATPPRPPDYNTVQPLLKAIVTGTNVRLPWKWQGLSAYLESLEIQVDRDDAKGYIPLVMDTTPGYNDNAEWPEVATKWKYRAIWRKDDARRLVERGGECYGGG